MEVHKFFGCYFLYQSLLLNTTVLKYIMYFMFKLLKLVQYNL